MTTNKDDFYLKDIDLLRALEPIMKKKGIEVDRRHIISTDTDPSFPTINGLFGHHITEEEFQRGKAGCLDWDKRLFTEEEFIPTWRKDSLEAALPEWCFNLFPDVEGDHAEYWINDLENIIPKLNIRKEALSLLDAGLIARGQESLEALAQLIILLDEEKVNE